MTVNLLSAQSNEEFVTTSVSLMSVTIREATKSHGFAIVGLSGGSTPKPIYKTLGKEKGIDWGKVWIFLVDDRHIRADDPKSNQFLLRSTLLKNAPIPESQLIFPDTTLSIDECIDLYDRHVSDLLKKGPPDLITLGMGDDGHIASLFPPLDQSAFGPASVVHTTTDRFDVRDRISVTMQVLTKARQSVFFLKGAAKKSAWDEMMKSGESERRWPAKGFLDGRTTIVVG